MRTSSRGASELRFIALGVVAVLVLMAAATVLLGWHVVGVPGGYDIVADPAGSLPF